VFRKHPVVRDGRRAVVRYDGRVVDVLDAGRHRLEGRARRRSVEVLDVRQQLLVLTGQEVAAVDVPGVRVSAAARFAIADPVAFLDAAVDPEAELRRALLATATAAQEGQAALERARGEVAATRALANAARVLSETPALLQLRTVQEAARAGSTVVLHVGEA